MCSKLYFIFIKRDRDRNCICSPEPGAPCAVYPGPLAWVQNSASGADGGRIMRVTARFSNSPTMHCTVWKYGKVKEGEALGFIFFGAGYWVLVLVLCVHAESLQSCLTPCDPMDCSPPGSAVHGILQARRLECVAISFSRGASRPKDQTQISCIAGRFFIIWAIGKSKLYYIMDNFPFQIEFVDVC